MIQIFEYEKSPIQFEVIDGQVMANATLMAKAFGKDMSSIFSTKSWFDFEMAVSDDLNINSVDLRRSKSGPMETGGGTWIHEELVIEFSRRINAKFSLWCNRKVSELLRTGSTSLRLPDFTNPAESARAWATQFEEKQAALQLVDAKEKEIQELWPKAKATEELLESHDSISIGDFAKAINYGQNKLFEVLRTDKILIDSGSKYNQPYQSYIDRGYFELQELTKLIKDQRKIFFQTRVTPKGQVYLIKHIESKKAS